MKKTALILALSTTLLVAACANHSGKSCAMMSRCSRAEAMAQADHTPAYFAFDSAVLSLEDKDNLDQIAQRLKANPGEKVRISGYTDSTGPDAYNQELSEQRAMSAARYLEGQGIAKNRITTQGYGATNFADPNTTQAGRAKNRRVEVSFY